MTNGFLEPFAVGHLDVGAGHALYYEQVGHRDGTPVVYAHGGPGSGCTPGARENFDLQRHRAVLFDQRGAGRSTPHAASDELDWASIDMDHHVAAYNTLLMDPDPDTRDAAAVAWCQWEDAHVATTLGARPNPRYEDPEFRLAFARQVTHCWRHNSWLGPDEIVRNAGRLAGVPGWLIHGRLDVSGPLDAPWRIHQAWPGSELIIVDDEGHGGDGMLLHWRRILASLA